MAEGGDVGEVGVGKDAGRDPAGVVEDVAALLPAVAGVSGFDVVGMEADDAAAAAAGEEEVIEEEGGDVAGVNVARVFG